MVARRRRRRSRGRPARRDPQARERALEALGEMRSRGWSLTRAARETQTTPETVRKYVGRAVFQGPGGRWRASASDRLTRHFWLPTPKGNQEFAIQGSRKASLVGRYAAALKVFLNSGDQSVLREFRGQSIRTRSGTYRFLTDPRTLERLALAGETSIDRLYSRRN